MSQQENTNDLDVLLEKAYQALAQKQPQVATQILASVAHQTSENEALAMCWLEILSYVEDQKTLEKEWRRYFQHWISHFKMMMKIAQITILLAKKADFRTKHDENSLVFLVAQAIGFHLYEHPPSNKDQRSQLYIIHAQLCALGDIQGEEQALSDLEIALSLNEKEENAWFLLSRIHSNRGRWEKALQSLDQIDIDALRTKIEQKQTALSFEMIQWQRAMCALALCFKSQNQVQIEDVLFVWEDLGHTDFKLDQKGRPIKPNLKPVEIYLHSEMNNVAGQYEIVDDFKAEKVLVQALSPCHGRIIQPSILNFEADFDDMIIWDIHPVSIDHLQNPMFKAIACLEKGNASTKEVKVRVLNEDELKQLNDGLAELPGVFFYQDPQLDMPHGKLVYPRYKGAFEAVKLFEKLFKI